MSGTENCRRIVQEIWAAWPEASSLSEDILRHAEACPACRAELESLYQLCRRSTGAQGKPLSWATVLPESRWARLAAATRERLRSSPKPLVWAPAFALALALLLIWNTTSHRTHKAAPAVPAEVVENWELLEHLDLLQNLDMVDAITPRKEEL